jgi:vacuolar transporter chaperone complex subunit 4
MNGPNQQGPLLVDIDILKPDTGAPHFERPSHTSSPSTSNSPHTQTPQHYTEPLSEGEEDEEVAIAIARDEDKTAGLDPAAATEAISYRESFLQQKAREDEEKKNRNGGQRLHEESSSSEDDERTAFLKRRKSSAATAPRPRNLSIDPLTPSSFFDKSFKSRFSRDRLRPSTGSALDDSEEHHDDDRQLEPGTSGRNGEVEYVRGWRAQDGKKISVPVRIEPKVYFAAERTFLVSVLCV